MNGTMVVENWREVDPDSFVGENSVKASAALHALLAYRDAVGGDEDFETTSADLYADLLHLADALGADQPDTDMAERHYSAEINGTDILNKPASTCATCGLPVRVDCDGDLLHVDDSDVFEAKHGPHAPTLAAV